MLTLERGSPGNDKGRNADMAPRPVKTASLLAGFEGYFDTTTTRKAQAWGEALAREIEAWRHIQRARSDGYSVERMARKIAAECSVSIEYARLASRLMNGGR